MAASKQALYYTISQDLDDLNFRGQELQPSYRDSDKRLLSKIFSLNLVTSLKPASRAYLASQPQFCSSYAQLYFTASKHSFILLSPGEAQKNNRSSEHLPCMCMIRNSNPLCPIGIQHNFGSSVVCISQLCKKFLFSFFSLCFDFWSTFGTHPVMFRGYSAQQSGINPGYAWETIWMLGMVSGSALCNVNPLPAVVSLQLCHSISPASLQAISKHTAARFV